MQLDKKNKEKMAVTVGLILIFFVALLTFLRPSSKNDNSDGSSDNSSDETIDYPKISAADLQQKLKSKENIAIIDTRSNDEFQLEHIIDSINIPLAELAESKIDAKADGLIVILASDISQNAEAIKVMERKGFQNVVALSGAITAWKSANGKTISWGDPTSFVNQSKVTFISPEDLKKRLDEKIPVFILDVRKTGSFSPHIPGAVNIPFGSLEKRRNEIPINKEVVVCGETELQEFQAGVQLYDLDIISGSVLKGGFPGWKEKGYPLEQ